MNKGTHKLYVLFTETTYHFIFFDEKMSDEDIDNPFVECELCETMVRFNDYHQHIAECMDYPRRGVPQLSAAPLQGLYQQRRGLFPRRRETHDDADDEREDDTENAPNEDRPQSTFQPFSFQLNYQFNIPAITPSHDDTTREHGDVEDGEYEETNDEEGDEEIPALSFSSILRTRRTSTHGESDNATFSNVNLERTDTTLQRLEGLLQQVNAGLLQTTDLTQIVNELEPLLPLTPIVSDSASSIASPFVTHYPLNTISSLFPLPPLGLLGGEEEDDYEYNLMLASRLGRVERGIRDIDHVSHCISPDEIKENRQIYENEMCPICQEKIVELVDENIEVPVSIRKTLCNHLFCQPCISKWLHTNVKCPVCQVDLDEMKDAKKNA